MMKMYKKYPTAYGKFKIYRPNPDAGKDLIMVIPGFGESLTHTKKLVAVLVREGYDAFTFTAPRRRGKKGELEPVSRKGEVVLEVLNIATPDGKKVHAVAHSMGCAAALHAAMQSIDRFGSLILMQPLGMVGEQSFTELLKRITKKNGKECFRCYAWPSFNAK